MSSAIVPPGRFATLDGMRGVAALIVIAFHYEGIFPVEVAGGYLAVDLFFMLSGFVLAAVYVPRFERGMGMRNFMISRARRLYPFYLFGLMLGLGARAWQDPGSALLALPLGLLGLPTPGDGPEYLYHLNSAYWSLFAEWVINVAFVLILWRLPAILLAIVAAAGAAGLVWAWQVTGTLDGGAHWADAWIGLARVQFGFAMGMLLHRAFVRYDLGRWRTHPGWLGLALPVLMLPCYWGPDLLVVMLVFPALVLVGAMMEPRKANMSLWLGEISYPLYCLHGPLQIPIRGIAVRTPWPELVGLVGYGGTLVFTIVLMQVAARALRGPRPIPATT
ncbi:acyltransferase [Croceibacterium sp. TMG7-5b_MA50]|uniref:acyltransferase family protein n=1 Tax=Croceibacterium sp. TMG7-5b_MA50 TaxID=3121290 RepID=UPI003221C675